MTLVIIYRINGLHFCIVNKLQLNNGTQSILCVIDFSESSVKALKWAGMMAIRLNAHLTIVHPYRLNQLKKKEDIVIMKKNIDIDAVKNFENLAVELFKNGTISYDFHVEVGFIQDRVQEYLRKKDILFIVVGKKLLNNRETMG